MEKSKHNHFCSYASTNTSLFLVICSLKLEMFKPIKENPEFLHVYAVCPVCVIIKFKMPDRSVFCTMLELMPRQQTVSFCPLKRPEK